MEVTMSMATFSKNHWLLNIGRPEMSFVHPLQKSYWTRE